MMKWLKRTLLKQVFVSYAHRDTGQSDDQRNPVDHLCRALKKSKFRAWIDSNELRSGEDFDESIRSAIESSFASIICLSNASVRSSYVALEVGYSMSHGNLLLIELEELTGENWQEVFNTVEFSRKHRVQLWNVDPNQLPVTLDKLIVKTLHRIKLHQFLKVAGSFFCIAVTALLIVLFLKNLPYHDPLTDLIDLLNGGDNVETFSTAGAPLFVDLEAIAYHSENNKKRILSSKDSINPEKEGFHLSLQPQQEGFLYVFEWDVRGNVQWLYPANQASPLAIGANPVFQMVHFPQNNPRGLIYFDHGNLKSYISIVFSNQKLDALIKCVNNSINRKSDLDETKFNRWLFQNELKNRSVIVTDPSLPEIQSDIEYKRGQTPRKGYLLKGSHFILTWHYSLELLGENKSEPTSNLFVQLQ